MRFAEAGKAIGDVELADLAEVVAEGGEEGGGEHGEAVLVSLAVANGDLLVFEVEVFDSQSEGLEESEAGAVEEGEEESVGGVGGGQDAADLALGEDQGLAGAAGDAHHGGEVDGASQDVAVEEEECGQGLGLGRGGDVAVARQVGEEGGDAARGEPLDGGWGVET